MLQNNNIQFKADFVGQTFLNIPEMTAINFLFQKAQSGILIKGKTRDVVAEKMYILINSLKTLWGIVLWHTEDCFRGEKY